MGDADDGLTVAATTEILQELLLRLHVQGTGRLVQEQDRALPEQCPGNGNTLRLTFAEPSAKLAAKHVETARTLHDETGTGRLQSLAHVFFGSIWIAKQQVVAYGAAEKRVALRHID